MVEWWAEWSAYTLADLLMFSPHIYYRLFEQYNVDIWPGQLIAAALGLAILVCALRPGAAGARAAAGMLAACWLWVGWAFLARRYAPINWAADYFALGFAIEALLLFWTGTARVAGVAPFRWPRRSGDFGVCLACLPVTCARQRPAMAANGNVRPGARPDRSGDSGPAVMHFPCAVAVVGASVIMVRD
ncbi:DUF6064 family protein [Noviherbaspirillum sedimenti]|uniref:DUF6064 family protein n=1 Tax=Noviherbaspirillum sedimenti TaxID=2320865 RepID=UPI0018F552DA|nr:DUF6064 family protein [Noviherbaspirillum sedimenti]